MQSFDVPYVVSVNNSWTKKFQDNKVHGGNMGPTWVLSSPGGPHVGPMNLAIRAILPVIWDTTALLGQHCDVVHVSIWHHINLHYVNKHDIKKWHIDTQFKLFTILNICSYDQTLTTYFMWISWFMFYVLTSKLKKRGCDLRTLGKKHALSIYWSI